jgi:hypothetical protein
MLDVEAFVVEGLVNKAARGRRRPKHRQAVALQGVDAEYSHSLYREVVLTSLTLLQTHDSSGVLCPRAESRGES